MFCLVIVVALAGPRGTMLARVSRAWASPARAAETSAGTAGAAPTAMAVVIPAPIAPDADAPDAGRPIPALCVGRALDAMRGLRASIGRTATRAGVCLSTRSTFRGVGAFGATVLGFFFNSVTVTDGRTACALATPEEVTKTRTIAALAIRDERSDMTANLVRCNVIMLRHRSFSTSFPP